MTNLENAICKIKISVDESYPSAADFESRYDFVINPDDLPRDDYSKAYAISVKLHDREYSIAFIGASSSWDTNCAVIENEQLTILQGWRITQLDVSTASVIRTMVIDTMAPNFEIHQVESGYLIYGETDITMLNSKLEKQWSFRGHDIFVSITGKKAFEITTDRICLYDFEDNYYELDFRGKEIHSRNF